MPLSKISKTISKSESMNSVEKKLSKQYQSMTALEHILKKPDTYIGAIQKDNIKTWVLNNENKFEYKTIEWVPGL